ncbi:MAG: hypothetical protein M0R17_00360 [Candidatus Omnitrophica bacterium]|jgi:replicative DNA helicase|nr:hypothetical protein [Candidatus Omnitrophota bacterium]
MNSLDDFSNLTPTEIEDIVLRYCFKNHEAGDKIFPLLTPDLFQDEVTQRIIVAIQGYFNEFSRYPRPRELYDFKLQTKDEKSRFDEIGKINLSYYTDDLIKLEIEKFIRGKLTYLAIKKTAEEWKANNYNTMTPVVEEIKKAVNFTINTKVGISVKKDFDSLMDYLQKKIKMVPSAFTALNGLIDGGHPAKAVTMYFGEANIGKTTFLCNDAAFAIAHGYSALYVTLEMPDFEIFKKIAANLLEVPVNKLKDANTSELKKKMEGLCKADLKIIEYPSFEMTAYDLRNILSELAYKEHFKPDIIFIDYVNCMLSSKQSGGQRHEDLGYIMKELENIAKEFDLPIVSCSQLNRDGYGTLEVSAKNIGESIDIIKYCAQGYAIMRDPTMKSKGLFLVKILKNRYGPNELQFYLKGRMEIMKITDATRNEVESIQTSIQTQNVVDADGATVESVFDDQK